MRKLLKVVSIGVLASTLWLSSNLAAEASRENIAVVQKGDTLYKIASMHDITVPELMKVNCLTDVRLKAGTVLYIYENPKYKKEISSVSSHHVVKQGETLWSISKKYGVTVEKIRIMNKIKHNNIKVGQALKII